MGRTKFTPWGRGFVVRSFKRLADFRGYEYRIGEWMSARKKALVGLASAALAFGFSGTASAGSYNGVCESSGGGEACLYRLENYSGGLYDTLYSKSSYDGSTYYGTSTAIDNTVSSVKNMDPDTLLYLYQYSGYTGALTGIPPGDYINQLGSSDNTTSSHCFGSNSACPN